MYHDTFSTFPIGHTNNWVDEGHDWGQSWWVGILPYLEQANIYQGIDQSIHNSGYVGNATFLNGKGFATRLCPSSPLGQYEWTPHNGPANPGLAVAHYTGISGKASAH